MAWSDKPTDNQVFAVQRLVQWVVSMETEKRMADWLRATATRKQVSAELERLHDMYCDHKLTRSNVFDSPIWDGFKRKEQNAGN